MKKLFIYDIELWVVGTYNTRILKREKGVDATVPLDGSIISDKEYIEIANEIKDNYLKKLNEKLINEGKVEIIDWSEPFLPEKEFNYIGFALINDCHIREATLKEAMEILTQEEFNEIYGNIIKIGGKNNG